jgi:hypothetical protein
MYYIILGILVIVLSGIIGFIMDTKNIGYPPTFWLLGAITGFIAMALFSIPLGLL